MQTRFDLPRAVVEAMTDGTMLVQVPEGTHCVEALVVIPTGFAIMTEDASPSESSAP